MHAIPLQGRLDRRPTGSRDVPRGPRLGLFGVRHVGAGLVADADGVEGEQDGVHDDGEKRMEDMGDVHDAFDQEKEEGEHGDDDVELGGAAGGRSVARREQFRHFQHVRFIPRARIVNGPIVGKVVEDLIGIAIPAMDGSFLPEFRSIQIRGRDAEQRQRDDGQGQLQAKQIEHRLRCAPLAGDGLEARLDSHRGGGGRRPEPIRWFFFSQSKYFPMGSFRPAGG